MSLRIPNKLLFLHHARTGGTAVREALRREFVVEEGPGHQPAEKKNGEICFTIIRNPYDVLATWWVLNDKVTGRFNKQRRWLNFEEFLFKYNHSYMRRDGRLYYMADQCDELILYENLWDGVNDLLKRVGLMQVIFERTNVTANKAPWEEYYTEHCYNIVNALYKEDLELYERLRG